jgi:hypothetical protein
MSTLVLPVRRLPDEDRSSAQQHEPGTHGDARDSERDPGDSEHGRPGNDAARTGHGAMPPHKDERMPSRRCPPGGRAAGIRSRRLTTNRTPRARTWRLANDSAPRAPNAASRQQLRAPHAEPAVRTWRLAKKPHRAGRTWRLAKKPSPHAQNVATRQQLRAPRTERGDSPATETRPHIDRPPEPAGRKWRLAKKPSPHAQNAATRQETHPAGRTWRLANNPDRAPYRPPT